MTYNDCPITMVWLDLDDTIIDFTTNARNALRAMFESEPALQAAFPSADIWAERYELHNYQLWDAYSRAEITRDHLRMERFRLPLTEAGIPDAEARTLSSRYDTLYLDLLAQGRALMPGAITLLDALRSDPSLRIAILSNGFQDVQHRKIANCGLTPYFDLVVLSDDIGINKPDTRLFDYAMAQAGDTNPKHHLMIGDNPQTDIAGALCAGWHAIHYSPRNANPQTPAGADLATSLTDIRNCLNLCANDFENIFG